MYYLLCIFSLLCPPNHSLYFAPKVVFFFFGIWFLVQFKCKIISLQIWKIDEENILEIREKDKYSSTAFYIQVVFVYFQVAVYY